MRKILFPLLMVLALLLSACGTAKTATTTTTATTVPTAAANATTVPGATIPAPTPTPFADSQTVCKPYNVIDDILPASLVPIPDVTSADRVKGPAYAPVTFIVYTDLQCPFCAEADPIINAVVNAFPNDVRLAFRHWPLASIHANALQAARAAEAAEKQGKFFNMTEFLFTNQSEWSAKSAADFTTWLNGKAASLGLDAAKFAKDWNDPAIVQKVISDQAAGDKLREELSQAYQTGFGTPTLIINGSPYMEQRSVELLSLIVNLIKNKSSTVQQCPATIIDPKKDYSATLTTTKGDIVIDLLEKSAPVSVNSFVSLAQNGWFKDNAFFVVNSEFVITGDKTNTGYGGPGYAIKDEIDPAYSFDKEGVVGMYNFGPGKNSSEFFILKAPFTELKGHYTIFGMVTQGMDVLKAMALYESTQGLDKADKILSVTITAK